jgi:hypothetical protein
MNHRDPVMTAHLPGSQPGSVVKTRTDQSTVVLDGDRATGESYCIAHHLYEVDGQRTLMKASIRYLDQFARQSDGSWLFAERKLMVDWTETRPSNP